MSKKKIRIYKPLIYAFNFGYINIYKSYYLRAPKKDLN